MITRSNINPYLEDGAVVLDGETVRETGAPEAMRACLCYEVSERDGAEKRRERINCSRPFHLIAVG